MKLTQYVEIPQHKRREGPDTKNYRIARTVAGWVVFTLGVIIASIGIAFASFELWHIAHRTHPTDIKNLMIAGVFVLAGGMLIQTQSVEATISFLATQVPLLNSRRVGGKRSTDPPEEK